MFKYLNIIFVLVISSCVSLFAQLHLVFTPIDTKNGLSENRIRSILQLSDGRMAIMTEGIMNIYDGTIFKHVHLKGTSILPLTEYKGFHHGYVDRDYIWMKNRGQLMLMDVSQERFVSRPDSVLASMHIREPLADFFMDDDQNDWFRTASDNMIYRNSRTNKTCLFVKNVSLLSGARDELYDLAVSGGRVFFFYQHGQVVCCDLKSGKKLYRTNVFPENERTRYDRTLMLVRSKDMIYQLRNGAKGAILHQFNVKLKTWKVILNTNDGMNTLTKDKQGNLWVGSNNGLWYIDNTLQNKTLIRDFRLADGSVINSVASTQFHDSQGGLWIGTFNRGLLYYHPDRFKFRNIGLSAFPSGIKGLEVTCFSGNDNRGVMVGTTHGLFHYKQESGRLDVVSDVPADAACISMTTDSQNHTWLCTENRGVYCFDKTGLRHFVPPVPIRQICTVSGRVYAATNDGLGFFNPLTGTVRRIPLPVNLSHRSYISQLLPIDNNRLLFRGNAGLIIYDLRSKKFSIHLNELLKNGNQQFNCICRDRYGRVWIGSQDGLYVWIPASDRVYTLYTDDGLVNNCVKGIQEDHQGRIWVTTAEGISSISVMGDKNDLKFSFSNYNIYDGVLGNEFTTTATWLSSHGLLLLGGLNGFNTILLNKPVAQFSRLPQPLFTGLRLFGDRVKPGVAYDGNMILSRSITTTERIVLNHNQNFISLEFSALNYVNPTQTYFRYRLEGVDENWREVTSSNGTGVATYTNLSPGIYRFQVKSANNSKVWTAGYSEIMVEVKAPFWKTPLAYFIYLILSAASLFILLKYYQRLTHQRM
ncbi:MAG: two-component regulator propeller domain-containing protein, partial [Bacteroidota bacterium]|nr:two-component regulator propeller domain-containing protein [Bacteroidota bacterium]